MSKEKKTNIRIGILLVAIGVLTSIMIYLNPQELKAPAWVVYTAMGSFVLAGASIIFHSFGKDRYSTYMVGLILISFTVIGGWIGFGSGVRSCSISIPGIASASPGWLCRGVFGFGTIVCGMITFFIWRKIPSNNSKKSGNSD
jgi:hypothetical protein